jgi:hypothetical protein
VIFFALLQFNPRISPGNGEPPIRWSLVEKSASF